MAMEWLDVVKDRVKNWVEQFNAVVDESTFAWMVLGYVEGVLDMLEVPYGTGEVHVVDGIVEVYVPIYLDEDDRTLVIRIDVRKAPTVLQVDLA